ncbi:large ribosomal subunit protein mL64-like [Amphiura filiformis]|uniref:large ribosomal subunit protein mL64-like n=1 Tax=Amphiura filiformis TaxID=82378 RepID=UPI003B21F95B
MAASRCRSATQKVVENVWLFRQNTMSSRSFQGRNCLSAITLSQSIRHCGQFTNKTEQMDKSRLQQDLEGENPNHEHDEQPESEQKRIVPPPYLQRLNRYYESRTFMAKKYSWEGKASGIDPSIMWPTKTEVEKMKAFEKEWCPTLLEMQEELEAERKQRRLKELQREKIIAANMAKMPQWLKEFDDKILDEKRKEEEQKKKRAKLLVEARLKLGYHVDHRSKYFKSMLEEMELEEKKRRKEEKKKARRAKLGMAKLDAE